METEVLHRQGFGGSLPVENVQALASKNLKEIPPRYIRPEIEFDVISMDEYIKIPVIDMSKLEHDDEQQKLHSACKDWGFFQLINHGVGDEVIEKMKTDIQEFFKLPLEEKMICAQVPNNVEGYGQAFVHSEDQKLDWGDMLYLVPRPVAERNMRFWPTTPPSFRATLDKYSVELKKVTIHLLSLMAKNLGTDPETFTSFFEDGTQGMRMNYYPPSAQARKVFGLSPHSDSTGLTLLIQVNEVEGLQIKKNGKWVPVKPIPDAFVINIGDTIEISLQIMSNGEYKSIEHRAIVNPYKERLSIAAFHHPNMSTKIGPLQDLVKANEARYRSVLLEEFLRLKLSRKLDGKSAINKMKL